MKNALNNRKIDQRQKQKDFAKLQEEKRIFDKIKKYLDSDCKDGSDLENRLDKLIADLSVKKTEEKPEKKSETNIYGLRKLSEQIAERRAKDGIWNEEYEKSLNLKNKNKDREEFYKWALNEFAKRDPTTEKTPAMVDLSNSLSEKLEKLAQECDKSISKKEREILALEDDFFDTQKQILRLNRKLIDIQKRLKSKYSGNIEKSAPPSEVANDTNKIINDLVLSYDIASQSSGPIVDDDKETRISDLKKQYDVILKQKDDAAHWVSGSSIKKSAIDTLGLINDKCPEIIDEENLNKLRETLEYIKNDPDYGVFASYSGHKYGEPLDLLSDGELNDIKNGLA